MLSFIRPLRGLCRNSSLVLISSSRLPKQHDVNCIRRFKSILGQSSVLMQDGTEIRELPWVVRKLNCDEILEDNQSKTAFKFTGGNFLSLEKHFKSQLQNCNSMQEVIHLLEVPGKVITAETAGSVLCRIGMFESSDNHLASFLQHAVLKELCDAVSRDFNSVSNRTVINLMKCCLKANSYDNEFIENISNEVELRISKSSFSILELCETLTFLSEHTGGKFMEILESTWIHLGSRYPEFNETNLSQIFEVTRYKPSNSEILQLAAKQFGACWEKLTPCDIAAACKWLSFFDHHCITSMSAVGKWLHGNVYSVNVEQMKHILGLFLHFKYHDKNVISSLCKFTTSYTKSTVRGSNQSSDRTIIQMIAMFCRSRRMSIPYLLNQIAADFQASSKCYDIAEGVSVLKIFGQLGHCPESGFFCAAEAWLEEKWEELSLVDMFEVLASFTYLERFPVNFMHRVFNSKVPELFFDNIRLEDRKNICQHLLELQASVMLEFPRKPFFYPASREMLQVSPGHMAGRLFRFHKDVSPIVKELIGEDKVFELRNPKFMPHTINFEVMVDPFKNALVSATSSQHVRTKIAIILTMPEDYTASGSMMGSFAMKKRHLEKMSYSTIMVNFDQYQSAGSKSGRVAYITSLLADHINLIKES